MRISSRSKDARLERNEKKEDRLAKISALALIFARACASGLLLHSSAHAQRRSADYQDDVGQMIYDMRNANSVSRMRAAKSLAHHISNEEVRRVMTEALLYDSNSVVQMAASEALIPYVNEPDVREAFLKALGKSRNAVVRNNVVKAVAEDYASERDVQNTLARVMREDSSGLVRMTISKSLGRYLDNPDVFEAWIHAAKHDSNGVVRMNASRDLAEKIHVGEVYELMFDLAKRDSNSVVRANALGALSRRIKERPELRDFFMSFLDDRSVYIQYHAVKGLILLNDPALSGMLIEKCKQIITSESEKSHHNQFILDTLVLLRRLDPQAAVEMLDRIKLKQN